MTSKHGQGESETSKRRLEAAANQRKALKLRKAGQSFDAIAQELGYASRSGAFHAVMSALRKTLQEPADEVRKMELERLDSMLEATWEFAMTGKPEAVDRVLKIMERRAKYLGLDAPKEINISYLKSRAQEIADKLGIDVADVLRQAEEVAASVLQGSEL